MKFCDDHWAKLRAAIDARGLGHLVGVDASKAMIEGQLAGEAAQDLPRDPLMSATFGIYGKAIEMGGLYLMSGDICPICEAVKHTAGVWRHQLTNEPMTAEQIERWWIDGPADAELVDARERGSVPAAQ